MAIGIRRVKYQGLALLASQKSTEQQTPSRRTVNLAKKHQTADDEPTDSARATEAAAHHGIASRRESRGGEDQGTAEGARVDVHGGEDPAARTVTWRMRPAQALPITAVTTVSRTSGPQRTVQHLQPERTRRARAQRCASTTALRRVVREAAIYASLPRRQWAYGRRGRLEERSSVLRRGACCGPYATTEARGGRDDKSISAAETGKPKRRHSRTR
jgi:hypothetical protein